MFAKFSGQNESDSSLDLSRADGSLAVVGSELGSFVGNLVEDVTDEGVQDGHGLGGDTSVWVNLLEDSVDVGRVGLLSSLSRLLSLAGGRGLGLGSSLLGSLSGSLAGRSLTSLRSGSLGSRRSGLRGLEKRRGESRQEEEVSIRSSMAKANGR